MNTEKILNFILVTVLFLTALLVVAAISLQIYKSFYCWDNPLNVRCISKNRIQIQEIKE